MLNENIKNLIADRFASYKFDESMKNHTSFKIGGPADVMFIPESVSEIQDIIMFLKNNNIPFFIMGNGSNLLVSDKGIRGAVIKISKGFSDISVLDEQIDVCSGMLLSKLANTALEHGLSGLEFASGIPGTVGGGIYMNAGAYGGEMKDVIESVTYLDTKGKIKTAYKDELCFGYRKSMFTDSDNIILSSRLKLKKGEKSSIKELMDDYNGRRRDKQPLNMPSAGSTFKRPEGYFAGKLIQDSGLKGYSIGGAQVSEKHSGFVINKGNATAQDVLDLIKYIQQIVYEKQGVNLQTEIRMVGEKL